MGAGGAQQSGRGFMKYRAFGNTGLRVSELGLGCSPLGGGLFHRDDRESACVLQQALDAGVNFFDTADNYSLGNSEALIGRAIRGRRDQVVIATKGGARFRSFDRFIFKARPLVRPLRGLLRGAGRSMNLARVRRRQYDYSDQYLARAVEGSLRRLGTDYIDLYQIYNPSGSELAKFAFGEILERLKAEGKIRHYGVSVNHVQDALIALKLPGVASVQLAVSLLDRTPLEQFLPAAKANGIGVIARSPLAQGLLTDTTGETMADRSGHFALEKIAERKAQVEHFHSLIRRDRTLAQVALRFILQLEGVSVVIPSAINGAELSENLGALNSPLLDPSELQDLLG